jgi:hypothetical protein
MFTISVVFNILLLCISAAGFNYARQMKQDRMTSQEGQIRQGITIAKFRDRITELEARPLEIQHALAKAMNEAVKLECARLELHRRWQRANEARQETLCAYETEKRMSLDLRGQLHVARRLLKENNLG